MQNVIKLIQPNYILTFLKSKNSTSHAFIRKIKKISKEQLIWFPGHIKKGIDQMNQHLFKSDLIIEIHDARIPFTGRTDLVNTFSQVYFLTILII